MADTDPVSLLAELAYEDPAAALAWLEAAFGLKPRMIVTDADGRVVFSETGMGGHTVAVVPEQPPAIRSPRALGGTVTQTIQVTADLDIDAHCARAQAAGATIFSPPTDSGIGRAYMAVDLEGHVWSFRKRLEGPGGALPDGWTVRFPGRGGPA
jgi:uncharacterized glyoxalase superfamily protein PhnB